MYKVVKSATKSAGKAIKEAIKTDPEVRRVVKKYPRIFSFIKKRLTPDEKFGLYLTVGVVITSLFVYFFLELLKGLFTQDILIMSDLRILNIAKAFRTSGLNKFMFFVTTLGSGAVIFVGTSAIAILFYIIGRWRYLVSILVSVIFGEIFYRYLKYSIERNRPPASIHLIKIDGYSFPSGHAFMAMVFYALLAYFIFRETKKRILKIFALIFFALLIGIIGLSRIYLGVHWPTDVLAGLAAGGAWTTVFITALEIRRKFKKNAGKVAQTIYSRPNGLLKTIGLILLVIWILFVGYFWRMEAGRSFIINYDINNENKIVIGKEEIPGKLFENLPRVSETIFGKPQEPIHLIMVGSQEQLKQIFQAVGWVECDRLNTRNITRLVITSILNKSYPKAPGLPSLWNTLPNDISFEKPTKNNSPRERNHIHFWETPYVLENGEQVWFATAHYDLTIKMNSPFILPTHTIDPAIDKEREEIKGELTKAGEVESTQEFQVVEPTLGKNQAGDLFFTDGKAYVFYLKQ